MQSMPAVTAKRSARRSYHAARRAALKKHDIERRVQYLSKTSHITLVRQSLWRHKAQMPPVSQPLDIFDSKRRRVFQERAGRRSGDRFLWQIIADDLADRLLDVTRQFNDVLIIGPMAAYGAQIMADREAQVTVALLIDEDRLPFAVASFDLIICAGTLDSVNDLPGALIQLRRCLRPDGLFLGHMFGAGTLASLKSALLEAEGERPSPHVNPQIDVRTAADLLTRAGFALPVVDTDATTVRYRYWQTLVGDIRDMGVGNALAGARPYLGRAIAARIDDAWKTRSSVDGKVAEHFVHIHLSGWGPSNDQPQPAKRGSGKVSLASVLSSIQPAG